MDIVIYILLLAGAVVGFWQGAFKQVANLLGIIAGLYLAMFLYDDMGTWLSELTGMEKTYGQIAAFVLIVILVPIFLALMASILTKVFSLIYLGWLNRLAGAIIGVVFFAYAMSVVLNVADYIISSAGTKPEKLTYHTELYVKIKQLSHFIVPEFIKV